MHTQELYQKAIRFATEKHLGMNQTIPGTNLPYVVHLSNVAMELLMAYPFSDGLNIDLAVQVALLHDVLEDTDTSLDEIRTRFGPDVAEGVLALTKDESLPKEQQMIDSLERIKQQSMEIWCIKLADRITNLQQPPPHWTNDKKISYRQEAQQILEHLSGANAFLENRLSRMIESYGAYIF